MLIRMAYPIPGFLLWPDSRWRAVARSMSLHRPKLDVGLDSLAPFVLLDRRREDRNQFGLARRAAGPRIHEGALGIERRFSGSFLVFDVGAEGLIRLHRHRRCEVGVALDIRKGVLTTETRVAVATE